MTTSDNSKSGTIGVVIGRFQVPSLHSGHLGLLEHVCNTHKDVLILLGSTPAKGTTRDPMDFETRKSLFDKFLTSRLSSNGWIKVSNLTDSSSDKLWSEQLDKVIKENFPNRKAVLYGGRDSFIPHYAGVFETQVVPDKDSGSGSAIRFAISKRPDISEDFRKGVIYGAYNQWPRVFMTVDVGIVRKEKDQWEILLAHKWKGDVYRIVGGFVDPTDKSAEAAAVREVKEETNLSLNKVTYLTSTLIDDWRYKETRDKIMTVLFVSQVPSDAVPTAGDDIVEVYWIPISKEGLDKEMHPSHVALLASVKEWCTAN